MPSRPVGEEEDVDDDFVMIFPITDIDTNGNDADDGDGNYDDSSDSESKPPRGPLFAGRFQPVMTLKQRRRSLLSATGLMPIPALKLNIPYKAERQDSGIELVSPLGRWKRAVRKIRTLQDPWEQFHLADLPAETVTRHRYNAVKQKWVVDTVTVKMEKEVRVECAVSSTCCGNLHSIKCCKQCNVVYEILSQELQCPILFMCYATAIVQDPAYGRIQILT